MVTASSTANPLRHRRLLDELTHAVNRVSSTDMRDWGARTAQTYTKVLSRRTRNLGRTIKGAGDAIAAGARGTVSAARAGHLRSFLQTSAAAFATRAVTFGQNVQEGALALARVVKENPREVAPKLLAGSLSFLLVSGGPDANGGFPDSDIAIGGIGAHRSLFTHSILGGAFLETLIYSLGDLMEVAHVHLPRDHDPVWDVIAKHSAGFKKALAMGAGLGMVVHLGSDGTWQPGTYHGIPIHLPREVHCAILDVNAAAEGIDVNKKASPFQSRRTFRTANAKAPR